MKGLRAYPEKPLWHGRTAGASEELAKMPSTRTPEMRARSVPPVAKATAVRERVLVVDDDRIILDSLGEFLKLEGYDVDTASETPTALAALARRPVGLVITDVNMPRGDGFELLRTIRQRHPDTVVIIITGYGTIESAVEAIKMGAYDYLTKPIIDDEIRLVVQRALQQQSLIRENRNLKEQLGL